jgi:hypothetical protein
MSVRDERPGFCDGIGHVDPLRAFVPTNLKRSLAARPSASFRPSCVNGPAQSPVPLQHEATLPPGHSSAAKTTEGLMLASPGNHQPKHVSSNDEQRAQKRHRARSFRMDFMGPWALWANEAKCFF